MEKYIFWFKISMHDIVFVENFECVQQLAEYSEGLFFRKLEFFFELGL